MIPKTSQGLEYLVKKGQREPGMGAEELSNEESHFVIEISMSCLPLGTRRKPLCLFGHKPRMSLSFCIVKKKKTNMEQENCAETFQTISFILCSAITLIVSRSKEACTI